MAGGLEMSLSAKEEIQINNINYGKKLLLAKDSYGTWTLIKQIKLKDW